ncbi:MAG TPA: amidohydrolase family protein [Planctomycetota bacterium]
MLLLIAPLLAALPPGDDDWTIQAATVHTVSGAPIENGFVRVQGGKIAAVGKGGGGATLECAAVTPGLIDLALGIDTGPLSVEQSSETAARLSASDGLDLFSYRWERALRSGITTALAQPADYDVIGGLGLVLKTGGAPTLAARLVKPEACLRGAIGAQPSNGNAIPRFQEPQTFYFRRPTTRMGVEWVFRKAFHDTLQGQGEDDPATAADHAVLRRVLAGELPLVVQAKATQDVRTAIYLKEEFGIPRLVLDHAIEAWREPELLKRSGVAVILPPFTADGRHADGFVNDSYFLPLDAARKLHEWGVPFALSAHEGAGAGARLADQAAAAQRGGLPLAAALEAVTLTPARLLGVEARVGSLEAGKDADLVLWNGPPLQPTSRIIGVLLQGRLVLDPRSK